MTSQMKRLAVFIEGSAKSSKVDIMPHCFDYNDRNHSRDDILAALTKIERIGVTTSNSDGQISAQVLAGNLRLVVRPHKRKPGWLAVVSAIPRDRACWNDRTEEV